MNWNKISIIISREYLNKVRKKSFLLTTFGVPLLMAAMYVVLILIMLRAKEDEKTVAVVDASGIVMPFMRDTDNVKFVEYTGVAVEDLKNNLQNYGADLLLSISPLDSAAKSVSATTYADKPVGIETVGMMESRINDAVEAYRIESYGIEGLAQMMKDVQFDVKLTSYTVDEAGKETISQSEVYMIISMALAMGIYFFIVLFGAMVMSSVIEEKSSRVVEVLVSSVKATELMMGKIIGVALVALTQFLLWIVLTGAIVGIIGGIVGFDKIMGNEQLQTQMAASAVTMPGMDIEGMTADLQALGDSTAVAEGPTGAEAVLGTLTSLPYGRILLSFLLYFLFGYLLYASLFAAIGSAVENEADTQQLQIPVTIPLLLGFFIAFYAFRAPESSVVWWGSLIPFTSPIVMLARIPFHPPLWELLLSLGLLVVTTFACVWAAAKIYKVGILMYGKKSTFKDLWKWLRQ